VHLGSSSSRTKEATRFLKGISCETLILNGDIIDGWALRKGGKWTEEHTKFIRQILKITYKSKTKVIYLRGNHDDFLEKILPISIPGIEVCKEYIYESNGKRYYVIHGDVFDIITTKFKFLSVMGGVAYDFLIWLNRKYNNYRAKSGKEEYSLSQAIKHKVKVAVSYMSDFENTLSEYAKKRGFDGVICGHIHHPEIKDINGVKYLNSGDWVESLTAIVETYEGEFNIIKYKDINTLG
ncbi:MAG TPA: UDP-2,3-diacylglucosamine diphosphatase, partial [Nitrosopumilaceae archaeon]|nr:UDP-2,3-diacylglucosamine diphosphatase [Nitrosopumilaceae archaeon]